MFLDQKVQKSHMHKNPNGRRRERERERGDESANGLAGEMVSLVSDDAERQFTGWGWWSDS